MRVKVSPTPPAQAIVRGGVVCRAHVKGRGADPLAPETRGPFAPASEVIAHSGPRPEADMQALMAEWL